MAVITIRLHIFRASFFISPQKSPRRGEDGLSPENKTEGRRLARTVQLDSSPWDEHVMCNILFFGHQIQRHDAVPRLPGQTDPPPEHFTSGRTIMLCFARSFSKHTCKRPLCAQGSAGHWERFSEQTLPRSKGADEY